MSDKPKRRLPVLPSTPAEEVELPRPKLHGVVLGGGTTLFLLTPLGLAVSRLAEELADSASAGVIVVALHVASLALSAFAGGYVVGRYGGLAGLREATLGGVSAVAIPWSLLGAAGSSGAGSAGVWLAALGVLVAVAGGAAFAGGRYGLRKRGAGP